MPRANPNTKRAVDAVLSGEMTVDEAAQAFEVKRSSLARAVRRTRGPDTGQADTRTPDTDGGHADTDSVASTIEARTPDTHGDTADTGHADTRTPETEEVSSSGRQGDTAEEQETPPTEEAGDTEPEPEAIEIDADNPLETLELIRSLQKCNPAKDGPAIRALGACSADLDYMHTLASEYGANDHTRVEVDGWLAEMITIAVRGTVGIIRDFQKSIRYLVAKQREADEAQKWQAAANTGNLATTLMREDLAHLDNPPMWKATLAGVQHTTKKQGKVETNVVLPVPVVLTAVIERDDEEYFRVEFMDRGSWRKVVAPAPTFLSSRQVVSLSSHGMGFLHSGNASIFARWIASFHQHNNATLPRIKALFETGWHTVDGQLVWITPGGVIGNESATREIVVDESLERAFGAASQYRAVGSWEGWCEGIRHMRPFPRAFLGMYTAVASMLLEFFPEVPNFTLSFSGGSTGGKTVTIDNACRVFGPSRGQPHSLRNQASSTPNALEAAATQTRGMPLIIDETQQVRERERDAFGQLLYGIANGKTRARSRRDGSRMESKPIRTLAMVTGETRTTAAFSSGKGGSYIRTFEVHGRPFGEQKASTGVLIRERIIPALEANAGQLAERVVRWCLNEGNRASLPGRFENVSAHVRAMLPEGGAHGRLEGPLALLSVAAYLVHELGMPEPQGGLGAALEPMVQSAIEAGDNVDRTLPALQVLHTWCCVAVR